MTYAVERTVTVAAQVPTLADVWAFIMQALDEVGPDPSFSAGPVWTYPDDAVDERAVRVFEVNVSGSPA